jgi:hypothetical protein
MSVRHEPSEWQWYDQGHDVGRDLAGGVPRGYEIRVRPSAIRLAAEQAFQYWMSLKNGRPVAAEAWEAFRKGFEAGWEETQGRGAKVDE